MQMDKVKLRWPGWEATSLGLKPLQEIGASPGESMTAWGGSIGGRAPHMPTQQGWGLRLDVLLSGPS